ncbi:MAG: 4-demethylwyosine synthase TYW1 [Candidatus Altiarchaeota archaeon]
MLPADFKAVLSRQHYGIVGGHSAVKPCLWLKKAVRGEGFCYKQKFYGIESHRCMQMTPAVGWCAHRCLFCWRNTEYTLGQSMDSWDEPEGIIDGAIGAHRQAVSGFRGLGVDERLFQEARKPKHVAISLAGEPTAYPPLGDLISGFKRRGMTTYLVTNGTLPERLEALKTLPTQLYLSVVAPDEETYARVCKPAFPDGWERIGRTLDLLPSIGTKKVVRITAVKGLNMFDPAGYARLIEKAQPDFVEVKAFMFVGGSRNRLSQDNMPSHGEVVSFAREVGDELSYVLKDEKEDSRVALLGRA